MLPVACPALAQIREKYGEAEKRGEVEVVTEVWMYHSLKSNSLLSPTTSFLYSPHLLDPIPNLSGSQIALCGFAEYDRRALVLILQSLGARIHGTFRVTSDVVISANPDDELERRASAWGARVAGIGWVEAMVQRGAYVMPREYPIRNPKPLDGVIVYVTDSVEQAEDMHTLAQSLGARYLTSFSPRCTHVVHMSKHPPPAKSDIKEASEVEVARGLGKFVVSPWWLTMCSRENARVDEVTYPSWYFPDTALLSTSV
ncbi:hypothetical protein BCR44DRAFT_45472 [Catenaria anguillulae PL171]|uniref:BRCT domain-containing protein n=1 Tax=Catenaria anguillulae PL171 TaxID=765915 RepID=A0A1Y2I5N3_9FUNG|nr:hypothetical protein BCR44DRAFT_45472 [Catenaria anguillulae PL171]